jgi:hypothetical protein
VASGEKRDQAQVNYPVLTHDHPAHRATQPLVDLPDPYRTFDPTTLYGYPSRSKRHQIMPHVPASRMPPYTAQAT